MCHPCASARPTGTRALHRYRHRLARQGLASSLALLLPVAALASGPTPTATPVQPVPSAEVQRVAQWALESKDNQRRPYVIVDKANALVFVFDAKGALKGAEAALLGMSRGDLAPTGTRQRNMAQLGPGDRVTPAGRFLANLDQDAHGQEVLLIDYEHSIALHPVVKGTVAERRAERLASPTAADNRISFGCINVPQPFFHEVVKAAFARTDGYVYILPESAGSPNLFGAPTAPK